MIGSIISGVIGMQGAQAGGNMAGDAANRAAQMQQQEAQRSRIALSPWTGAGESAINKITKLLGLGELTNRGSNDGKIYVDGANAQALQDEALNAFQTSPGYQWRKTEGINALDRSAAAKGLMLSGAQVKGVQAFGDGLASEEYDNYFNRLQTTAGMGQSAASSANSTSAGLTANAGSLIAQGGAARGSGYAQGANALASGIGSGINNVMFGLGRFGGGGGSSPHSLGGQLVFKGS